MSDENPLAKALARLDEVMRPPRGSSADPERRRLAARLSDLSRCEDPELAGFSKRHLPGRSVDEPALGAAREIVLAVARVVGPERASPEALRALHLVLSALNERLDEADGARAAREEEEARRAAEEAAKAAEVKAARDEPPKQVQIETPTFARIVEGPGAERPVEAPTFARARAESPEEADDLRAETLKIAALRGPLAPQKVLPFEAAAEERTVPLRPPAPASKVGRSARPAHPDSGLFKGHVDVEETVVHDTPKRSREARVPESALPFLDAAQKQEQAAPARFDAALPFRPAAGASPETASPEGAARTFATHHDPLPQWQIADEETTVMAALVPQRTPGDGVSRDSFLHESEVQDYHSHDTHAGAAEALPPSLTVEQYAWLVVACEMYPAHAEATLFRYGIATPAARAALDAFWTDLLTRDAGLRARWANICESARSYFRQQRR